MRVKWTVSHQLGGGQIAEAGDEAELHPREAERKIAMGFAQSIGGPTTGPGAAAVDEEPETGDPSGPRRRKG